MTYYKLVAHFGGLSKAAEALGIDRRQVFNWSERRIPSKWQLKAEHVTDGGLRADRAARKEAAEFSLYASRVAA